MHHQRPHRSVLRRWRCGVEFQPWGETKEKAHSERAKRGLRHIDPSVASSARSSGAGSRNQMGLLGGSAPVSKIDEGVGTAWPLLAGAVFLRLQQQLSPVSNDLSLSNYNSRF